MEWERRRVKERRASWDGRKESKVREVLNAGRLEKEMTEWYEEERELERSRHAGKHGGSRREIQGFREERREEERQGLLRGGRADRQDRRGKQ